LAIFRIASEGGAAPGWHAESTAAWRLSSSERMGAATLHECIDKTDPHLRANKISSRLAPADTSRHIATMKRLQSSRGCRWA
jgi:hypothetical protein